MNANEEIAARIARPLNNYEAKGYQQAPYPVREDYDNTADYKTDVAAWEAEWEARNGD